MKLSPPPGLPNGPVDALAVPALRQVVLDPCLITGLAAMFGKPPVLGGLFWWQATADLSPRALADGLLEALAPSQRAALAALAPSDGGAIGLVIVAVGDSGGVLVPLFGDGGQGKALPAGGPWLAWLVAAPDVFADRVLKDLARAEGGEGLFGDAALDNGDVRAALLGVGVRIRMDGVLVNLARRLDHALANQVPITADLKRLAQLLPHREEWSAYRPYATAGAAALFTRPGSAVAQAELEALLDTILGRPVVTARQIRQQAWLKLGLDDLPGALASIQLLIDRGADGMAARQDRVTLMTGLGWHDAARALALELPADRTSARQARLLEGLVPKAADDDRLVVHVGYGKTATSWLQRNIFPYLPDVHYHGLHFMQLRALAGRPVALTVRTPVVRALENAIHRDPLAVATVADRALATEGRHLISHESLVAGGNWADLAAGLVTLGQAVGRRLQVILTVRRQADLLWSYYSDIMATAGPGVQRRAWRDVLIWPGKVSQRPGDLVVDHFDFHACWQALSAALGPDNVCVLAMDDYVCPPHVGLERLAGFLGISLSAERRAEMVRAEPENSLGTRSRQMLDALNGDRMVLAGHLDAYFAASNQRLLNSTGISLTSNES